MKAVYRSRNGQISAEVEGQTVKVLFKAVANISEIFDAESCCGMCQSKNLRYSCRTVGGFDYYELVCCDCFAQFRFGQKKEDGGLFPKRLDDDGRPLPNGGWARYEGNGPAPTNGHSGNGRVEHANAVIKRGDINNSGGPCSTCKAPDGKPHGSACYSEGR